MSAPAQSRNLIKPLVAAVLLLWFGACAADVDIALDAAPGLVHLPDNWRPIPRAEIIEARERAEKVTGRAAGPIPAAAFQRLPTLQWFSLPHALVFWQPGSDRHALTAQAHETPESAASMPLEEQVAPDLRLHEKAGRTARGAVHLWHAEVLRRDGQFAIDLLTTDDDGRGLILGLAEGLRESH